MHPFEKAGLGAAPYKFIGLEVKVGPIVLSTAGGVTTTVGAPGQPMGCCTYCYTGIANCYKVRSADGNEFIVGSECIRKVEDKGLISAVRKTETAARKARAAERIAAARARLETPEVQAALSAEPHPLPWQAQYGKTALDWAIWMMRHAGAAGRMQVVRKVESLS